MYPEHILADFYRFTCGYTAETSEHFLLHCPLYNSIRNKTINKLNENERNINTLLFGNDQLHLETNKEIFVDELPVYNTVYNKVTVKNADYQAHS